MGMLIHRHFTDHPEEVIAPNGMIRVRDEEEREDLEPNNDAGYPAPARRGRPRRTN